MRCRVGSADTAIWCSSPTSPPCDWSPGWKQPPWSPPTCAGQTPPRSNHHPGASCSANWRAWPNVTYREAWRKGYRDLTPASDYNIDYALLASTRMEPMLRDIRNSMDAAGLYCEGVKGECNLGQQEISFRYAEALTTCDNHSVYKNGAKEIADKHGASLTFM